MLTICFKTHLANSIFLWSDFRYPSGFGSLRVSKRSQNMLKNPYTFVLQRIFAKLAINNMMAMFTTIIANNPTNASINVISKLISFPRNMGDNMFCGVDGSDLL